MQQPRRRSNAGAIVAVVVIGMFLVGVGTIGTALVSDTESSASDYDTPTYETNVTTSSSESSTETSSSESTSDATETTEVETGPEPVAALGDHPLYQSGEGAYDTSCSLPEFATDSASQDAFYQAALPCLMRAWTPALEAAGLPAEAPNVITTDQDINSPCGTRSWDQTAMYCSGNHTIYMTARYYAEIEGQTEPGVYLGQFAHEFGHAIQGMTGIMTAYGDAVYDAGGSGTPGGLELSRRTELQATCFEGEALAALQRGGLSNEYIFPALEDSSQRGDDGSPQPDHGSTETNRTWVEQGFYQNELPQCNTWLAPPEDVD